MMMIGPNQSNNPNQTLAAIEAGRLNLQPPRSSSTLTISKTPSTRVIGSSRNLRKAVKIKAVGE